MGEQLIISWLILELTDSAFMVGIAMSLRSAPLFFLGIPSGILADIFDRKRLLIILTFMLALFKALMAILILTNHIQVWHLLGSTLVTGSIWALCQPARQSLAVDLVGKFNAISGLATIGLSFRIGALLGSLVIGFLMERDGPGIAYCLLSISYVGAALGLILVMVDNQSTERIRKSLHDTVLEFRSAIAANSAIAIILLIIAGTEMFGFATQSAFPSITRDVLNEEAGVLGILNASRATGAITIIVLLSSLAEIPRKGTWLLISIGTLGTCIVLLGASTDLIITIVLISVMGGMMALSDIFTQGFLQTLVPDNQRGRAMGVWVVGIGTQPLGNLQIGALISLWGVSISLFSSGLALIIITLGVASLYPRLRRI